MLANWSPYRLSSRVQWHAIRAANRLGVLELLPSVESFEVQDTNAIDWSASGWSGAAPPEIAAYIGTPSPTQKAVLHLVDPVSRKCESIMKVPLQSGARNSILREADTLSALTHEGYRHAPRLLSLDSERGISCQQYLPGKPGSRRLSAEYLDLLRSLILPDESTSLSADSRTWKEKVQCTLSGADASIMQAALAQLEDERQLPACCVHGDFAPWNIRQRPHLAPALIDWEEARRGGLPLQDAYHFFHIQDFLFGGKPALHAGDLAAFANDLGITFQRAQKLEIAYLAQAHLRCRECGDESRAAFLMTTLAKAVQHCTTKSVFPDTCHTNESANAELASARAEMFKAVVAALNNQQIPYCLLSGYEMPPEGSEPDLDIMVRAQDQDRIPGLLAQVAQSSGSLLVQSLQHETCACYYILARLQAGQIAHLDIDCYSDYRRQARTWLRADEVIARRRQYRDFYVPAAADEFAYYLVKKVLKESITSHQIEVLHQLLESDPTECRQRIARFWPAHAPLVERAIVEQDLAWFLQRLPSLHDELQVSRPVENALRRSIGKLSEVTRLIRRAVNPTGMWVSIAGGDTGQRTRLASQLVMRLAPAFRRTLLIPPHADRKVRGFTFNVLRARVRSTLVISTAEDLARCGWLASYFVRPDLVLLVSANQTESGPRLMGKHRTIELCATHHPEDLAQSACDAVLQWLACRQEKRLNLPHCPCYCYAQTSPEAGGRAGLQARVSEISTAPRASLTRA